MFWEKPKAVRCRVFAVDSLTKESFREHIIAQHDDEDYDEGGYVAVVAGKDAALAQYHHCSCFGTTSDLWDDGKARMKWTWVGTVKEMVAMAEVKRDPAMPDRVANPEDSDYDHLMEVYAQVLKWAQGRKL